jgi:hypothetical protein
MAEVAINQMIPSALEVFYDALIPRRKQQCSLCMDDEPNLKLECSHAFHDECILNQLKAGWTGVRISFNFMKCAECRAPMVLPKEDTQQDNEVMKEIKELLQQHQELAKKVDQMAKNLIEAQEVKDDDASTMVFYPCFKCKAPYYAGKMDCAAELNIEAASLICPPCIQIENKRLVKAATGTGGPCPVHGDQFAVYKCSYCCGAANWQCGYGYFYCHPCHDGVGEKTPCQGSACHITVEHTENSEGVTFIIACNACELDTDNVEDVGVPLIYQ